MRATPVGFLDEAAGRIRPLRREDIPAIVALRRQVFRFSERADAGALARYLEAIFFRNPWTDPGLPSLVYEDATGDLCGFVGVVPRRMLFRGEPIRVAVGTQLMVVPSRRGALIGRRLVHAFISGPQDLSLSDTANEAARRLWEAVGGETSVLLSMTWTLPLRPYSHALGRQRGTWLGRGLALATRPLAAAADALVPRAWGGAPWRLPPEGRTEALDASSLLAHFSDVAGAPALRPVYEDGSLEWLLRQAADKRQFGRMRRVLARTAAGEVAGWFLYYLARGGTAEVVQMVAARARQELVFDHLCHHAWRRGATAISGRVDPALMPVLAGREARLSLEGPWVLVHARPEILLAIEHGDALLSRLEGEWWLSF